MMMIVSIITIIVMIMLSNMMCNIMTINHRGPLPGIVKIITSVIMVVIIIIMSTVMSIRIIVSTMSIMSNIGAISS